jgi:hypothetical protein
MAAVTITVAAVWAVNAVAAIGIDVEATNSRKKMVVMTHGPGAALHHDVKTLKVAAVEEEEARHLNGVVDKLRRGNNPIAIAAVAKAVAEVGEAVINNSRSCTMVRWHH